VAALGAAEQDGPPWAALARVADLDLAFEAAQALRCVGAVVQMEVVAGIGIRIAALGATPFRGAAASAFDAVTVLSATRTGTAAGLSL
jgi:hypothetical protein